MIPPMAPITMGRISTEDDFSTDSVESISVGCTDEVATGELTGSLLLVAVGSMLELRLTDVDGIGFTAVSK